MTTKRRFYVSPADVKGNVAILGEEESRHIRKVLRLKDGDSIELFNGNGVIYKGIINNTSSKKTEVMLSEDRLVPYDSRLKISLLQAVPKSKKMDIVIRMGTELGVSEFMPVISKRCEIIPPKRQVSLVNRWKATVLHSCKQCKRAYLPEIRNPKSPEEAFKVEAELKIIFSEIQSQPQIPVRKNISSVALAIGPEGGWTDEELEIAVKKGFKICSLGPRTLRTETAGASALSIIQYCYDNISK